MLQAIVGDDDLQAGMGGEQGTGGFYAATGNGGGGLRAAVEQQRFCARLKRGAFSGCVRSLG